MNELTLTELDMGIAVPKILQAFKPAVDHRGKIHVTQRGEVSNWSKGKYFLGGPVAVQLWIAWQTTYFWFKLLFQFLDEDIKLISRWC